MSFGRNGSRSCEGWVGAKQLESVGEAKNSPCDPICHCTNVTVWETQWSIIEVWTLATGTKKQCAKNTDHLRSYIYSYIIGDKCHTGDAYCLDCTHKACSKSSKQILAISPCWQKNYALVLPPTILLGIVFQPRSPCPVPLRIFEMFMHNAPSASFPKFDNMYLYLYIWQLVSLGVMMRQLLKTALSGILFQSAAGSPWQPSEGRSKGQSPPMPWDDRLASNVLSTVSEPLSETANGPGLKWNE